MIRIKLARAILMLRFSTFSEKLDHNFSQVFIFVNMFPETHGFVAMPVASCFIDTCFNLSLSNKWRETKLFNLLTSTASKPWLSGYMRKWIVVFHRKFENQALKLIEFTRLLSVKSFNLQLLTFILNGVGGPLWCWRLLTNGEYSVD